MFAKKDLKQIDAKGISPETVQRQVERFKTGFPFIRLSASAVPGKGLLSLDEKEVKELETLFDESKDDYEILKFVPASGAASRMFKKLFAFRQACSGTPAEIDQLEKENELQSVGYFFKNLQRFAFFPVLSEALHKDGLDVETLRQRKDYNIILDYILTDKGLNYGVLPKAMLHFHLYPDGPRRAFEEHLVEAANYAVDKAGLARVHFTVSPEHQQEFEEAMEAVREKYEHRFDVRFEINFSQQKASTDTVAVDMNNALFRKKDDSLLFRPGGHGALIENMNDLKGEVIFVKNIDNIVPDRLRHTTYLFKKVIGGLLLQLQSITFDYLDKLDDGNLSDGELEEIKIFAQEQLNVFIPVAYDGYGKMEKIDFLFNRLNRPMRVAGMVKNEGEPGGGPFWVVNEDDELSLQIVESSQIDFEDAQQKEIVSQSTHFNPVDLVCGVRNYLGEPFDLADFVDPQTGFISLKSMDGRDLKAQELPGLWNGAMADWITLFVETPIITFNPVKTINDLLRPQHQPER